MKEKFRKISPPLEAVQVSPETEWEILEWLGKEGYAVHCEDGSFHIRVANPMLYLAAKVGDWIIKGEYGYFHTCKHADFKRLYIRDNQVIPEIGS